MMRGNAHPNKAETAGGSTPEMIVKLVDDWFRQFLKKSMLSANC
jgi:hypothetical protein